MNHLPMKFYQKKQGGYRIFLLSLTLLLPASAFAERSESDATDNDSGAKHKLQELIQTENRIVEEARFTDAGHDQERLQREFQDLVNRYDSLINEHPEFPPAYVAYARVLERIGEERAARAMYMKANQLDPNIPLVKNQLGNFLAEDGEFAKALPYYLAAIELDPREPLYHYQLGSLLHHFRDRFLEEEMYTREVLDEKMLQAFAAAAHLAPDEIAFTYRHAEAYYDLEEPKWDEALSRWEKLRENARPGIEREAIDLHRAKITIKKGEKARARDLLDSVQAPALQKNRERLIEQLNSDREERDDGGGDS